MFRMFVRIFTEKVIFAISPQKRVIQWIILEFSFKKSHMFCELQRCNHHNPCKIVVPNALESFSSLCKCNLMQLWGIISSLLGISWESNNVSNFHVRDINEIGSEECCFWQPKIGDFGRPRTPATKRTRRPPLLPPFVLVYVFLRLWANRP